MNTRNRKEESEYCGLNLTKIFSKEKIYKSKIQYKKIWKGKTLELEESNKKTKDFERFNKSYLKFQEFTKGLPFNAYSLYHSACRNPIFFEKLIKTNPHSKIEIKNKNKNIYNSSSFLFKENIQKKPFPKNFQVIFAGRFPLNSSKIENPTMITHSGFHFDLLNSTNFNKSYKASIHRSSKGIYWLEYKRLENHINPILQIHKARSTEKCKRFVNSSHIRPKTVQISKKIRNDYEFFGTHKYGIHKNTLNIVIPNNFQNNNIND